MAQRSQARTLTDPQEIRRWAEERGARPACVRGTGGSDDAGLLRLDFPGYTGETSLEHIGWDEWLQKFEDNNLALLVQDATAGGQRSNFNKIVSRQTAHARGNSRASTRGSRTLKRTSARGGTSGARRQGGSKAARAGRGAKSQARSRGTAGSGTKSGRGGNARKKTSSRNRITARANSNTRKSSGRTTAKGRSTAARRTRGRSTGGSQTRSRRAA
jgi:hypothetical protein